MQTDTAAHGAHGTSGAGLEKTLDQVRKDHKTERETLYNVVSNGRVQETQIDTELREMSMRIYKTPHYRLKDFNIWLVIAEFLLLAIVAWSEYPFNVRGLEWFDFPVPATRAFAIGLGAVVAAVAFFAGNFIKKGYIAEKAMYWFNGLLLVGMGSGILYAICKFRSYYLADMATIDGPSSGELSMGVQMLISECIFLFGVLVAFWFANPVKDEATKKAFDAKRNDMIKVKKDIGDANKKLENHKKALDAKLEHAEKHFVQGAEKAEKKAEKKQKHAEEAIVLHAPAPVVSSKEQLTYESAAKSFDSELKVVEGLHAPIDADVLTDLEDAFDKLRFAAVNYPAGAENFKELETRFQTIQSQNQN